MPAEIVADLRAADRDKSRGFEVWRVNWPILEAFLAVATQWSVQALADGRLLWLGLDYARARAGLAAEEIVLTPAQWRGLTAMEREAAKALNGS